MFTITKGLNLPINGSPKQQIENGKEIKTFGLNGDDYVGMKPTMKVVVGDQVKIGQTLFECKKTEGVIYTSPVNGTVKEINRGERRAFLSVVIEKTGEEHVDFSNYSSDLSGKLDFHHVKNLLIESGLWTSIRTRPFSKIAPTDGTMPAAVFITAMDSNPLCADPVLIIGQEEENFKKGLEIVSHLTEGNTYLCKRSGASIPTVDSVTVKEFDGVHPAGNVGTHIHFVEPVHPGKTVWHVGYQDIIAIGHLFQTGKLYTKRVVSVAGPKAKNPRLLSTTLGACLHELLEDEIIEGNNRIVSGSVFNGRKLSEGVCYLGRYHNQVSLLEEGTEREFFGWHSPGFDKFSLKNIYFSKLSPSKLFNFNTSTNGSPRAIVPVGVFEKVMPLDIIATPLLKALVVNDTDYAQRLGCLELDEEDLALCTYASPGKTDFGSALRNNLTIIEKEG